MAGIEVDAGKKRAAPMVSSAPPFFMRVGQDLSFRHKKKTGQIPVFLCIQRGCETPLAI